MCVCVCVRQQIKRSAECRCNQRRNPTKLEELGFALQFRSLLLSSRASRLRVAVDSASCFSAAVSLVRDMRDNMNRTLHHCYFNWIDSSIIMNLQSNILTLRDLGLPGLESALAQTQVSQALTSQWLLTNADFPCFRLVLSRRLAYFFNPGTLEHLIPGLVEAYRLGNKVFKPAIIAAHLKACCNAWVTRRRFGDPAGLCLFCGAESDDIAHLLVCREIRNLLIDCLGGDFNFSLSQLLLLHLSLIHI